MKRIASTVFLAGLMGLPTLAFSPVVAAAVSVGVGVGGDGFSAGLAISTEPPPLPVYEQPLAPDQGYVWTPGYWAWAPAGYFYWVDGAWVLPPTAGLLWTPGWWGWSDGFFRWNPGYWGPVVGFYGGIDYGYGYFGTGYSGGYWMNNRFYYNTAVSRVNVTVIHNTYIDKTVIRGGRANRVSYNGGRGGISARPTVQQQAFARQSRVAATPEQVNRRDAAMRSPTQRYDTNRGRFSGSTPLRPSAPDSRGGSQQTAPNNRGPRSGVTRTPEPGNGSRFGSPQDNGQSQGMRGQGQPGDRFGSRPDVQRPTGPQGQSVAPGASRFDRGGAPNGSQPDSPAVRMPAPPAAPRTEPMSRPQVPQPSAPRVDQAGRPQMPQPSAPRVEPAGRPQVQQPSAPRFQPPSRPQFQQPAQPRVEQRPAAPQAPRFEPRAPRPEAAPRMESRPAPRVEAPRAAPRAQAPAERRGGGQDRGDNRRRE